MVAMTRVMGLREQHKAQHPQLHDLCLNQLQPLSNVQTSEFSKILHLAKWLKGGREKQGGGP